MSARRCLPLLSTLLALVAVAVAEYSMPGEPYEVMYRRIFANWPDAVRYCAATGDLGAATDAAWSLRGCSAGRDGETGMLLAAEAADVGAGSTAGAWLDAVRGKLGGDGSQRFAVAFGGDVPVDVAAVLGELGGRADVASIIFGPKAFDDAKVGPRSPNAGVSLYKDPHSWAPQRTIAASVVGMSVVRFPPAGAPDAGDSEWAWAQTWGRARANMAALSTDRRYSAETSYPMAMGAPPATAAAAEREAACLSQASPTCLPIGGQTAWGSTRRDLPAEISGPAGTAADPAAGTLPGPRPARTIALLAPASASPMFHQVTPAADGAASGIAALLAVLDALNTSGVVGDYLQRIVTPTAETPENKGLEWEPAQLAVLFPVADEHGLAGSGRFVRDIYNFTCLAAGKDGRACATPLTRGANFTGLRLSDFTHVIAIDQVGRGAAPVVHSDMTIADLKPADNTAQATLIGMLTAAGATKATGSQLPPNGAHSFVPALALKNQYLKAHAPPPTANTTERWLRLWSGSFRPAAVVAVAGFDTEQDAAVGSMQDTTADAAAVSRAAQAVLDTLAGVWKAEFDEFKADPFPGDTTVPAGAPPASFTVDAGRAAAFLKCFTVDINCAALAPLAGGRNISSGDAPPDYYPGVFQFYAGTPPYVVALQLVLLDIFAGTATGECAGDCPPHHGCLRGKCRRLRAWTHHAVSPGIDFVAGAAPRYFGPVVGATAKPAAAGARPLDDGTAVSGLPRWMMRSVWVESNWPLTVGGRVGMAAGPAVGWYVFGGGVVATALSLGGAVAAVLVLRR